MAYSECIPSRKPWWCPAAEYIFQCMASSAFVVSGIASNNSGFIFLCNKKSIEAWDSCIHQFNQDFAIGKSQTRRLVRDRNSIGSEMSRRESAQCLNVSAMSGDITALILLICVTPAWKCSWWPQRSFSAASWSSCMDWALSWWVIQSSVKPSMNPRCSASLKFITWLVIILREDLNVTDSWKKMIFNWYFLTLGFCHNALKKAHKIILEVLCACTIGIWEKTKNPTQKIRQVVNRLIYSQNVSHHVTILCSLYTHASFLFLSCLSYFPTLRCMLFPFLIVSMQLTSLLACFVVSR